MFELCATRSKPRARPTRSSVELRAMGAAERAAFARCLAERVREPHHAVLVVAVTETERVTELVDRFGRGETEEPSRVAVAQATQDQPLRINLHEGHLYEGSAMLPVETLGHAQVADAFESHGIESMSILTNTTLLQESDMLGVMPLNIARHYAKAGALALLRVPLPQPSGPVGIIARADQPPVPALDDLVAALRATGRSLARA